ncbi:helix-turn-helix domain-containing protein [Sphingomonas gellani]|uniref:helix-turn-helix domain-containing protein n=1 Tax=Sphingomonas gellani TaxID=1166340 RepID=UPI003CC7A46D
MSPRRPPRTRLFPGIAALRSDLGDRLRQARKGPQGESVGHKQEMLAHAAGISRSTLSRIEKGHVAPRMDTLERLMAALDITKDVVGEPGLTGAGQLMSRVRSGTPRTLTSARVCGSSAGCSGFPSPRSPRLRAASPPRRSRASSADRAGARA